MKYIDEFRDGERARHLASAIAATVEPGRVYRIMEFCGGHTHAISRYGLEDILPAAVRLIHGPGCPICVLPVGRIDSAVRLAKEPGVILCSYGDTMRVPGSDGTSLLRAKAQGADVRMVYSALDSVTLARENPDKTVVFFAIGFETTTPPTAVALKQAQGGGLSNFLVFCNHVLTPPAIGRILDAPGETVPLDAFIGPAHVSTLIGMAPYEPFVHKYGRPVVIAGFEPLDVLQSVLMLIRQINQGVAKVENEYTRAVTREGNRVAQALVTEVFELRDTFEWRGLGDIQRSALKLRPAFAAFDVENRWEIPSHSPPDHRACDCGAILRGVKRPTDCKLFGKACTPETPMGSCMVSGEGACAAAWAYGRFRDTPVTTA